MKNQILFALLCTVTIRGSKTATHNDTECSNNIPDQLFCKETHHKMYVNHGENLMLNFVCYDDYYSQLLGPNKISGPNTGIFMLYIQEKTLNQILNQSKYRLFSEHDSNKCSLQITSFLSDDDGVYKCLYLDQSTIYINVFDISAKHLPEPPGNLSACVHMEAIDCSNNSKKYNYHVWQIISSLLGGILILIMFVNIYCLLTRKTKSENVSENLQESQYYEIRPRNVNNMDHASIQGIRNYLQETVTSVNRLSSAGTDSITSSFQKTTSSESSVWSVLNLLLNENEYENPYQTIDHENIEMNPYSIITSDRYQNTTVFQKDIRTNTIEHAIQNVKEKDPWLIIYKHVKYIDKNHESIYEVLDTGNQEFTDIS